MAIAIAGMSLGERGGRAWFVVPKRIQAEELDLEWIREGITETLRQFQMLSCFRGIRFHEFDTYKALEIRVGEWQGGKNLLFSFLPPLPQLGRLLELILRKVDDEIRFFCLTHIDFVPPDYEANKDGQLLITQPTTLPEGVLALRSKGWTAHLLEGGATEIIQD